MTLVHHYQIYHHADDSSQVDSSRKRSSRTELNYALEKLHLF